MADVFSKKKRSDIMSRIRSKNSVAELMVFRFLRKEGIYFQKHYKNVPGKPDVALPRKKKAVFIDGEFWHGKDFEKRKNRLPKVYWRKKIEGNIAKDRRVNQELKTSGWKVLRVWEREIKTKKTREEALERIKKFLEKE